MPELTIDEPLLNVWVPVFGANVHVDPFVKVPAKVKLVFAVTVVDEHDVVKLKKVKVPEFVIVLPPFMVTVPELGVSTAVLLTVKVPATL